MQVYCSYDKFIDKSLIYNILAPFKKKEIEINLILNELSHCFSTLTDRRSTLMVTELNVQT